MNAVGYEAAVPMTPERRDARLAKFMRPACEDSCEHKAVFACALEQGEPCMSIRGSCSARSATIES